MRLSFADAQRNVAEIANRESYNKDVIFELLAAYGRSASAITKLRSGALNLALDKDNEVLQRGVVYFKHVSNGNLLSIVDSLDQDPLVVRYNPRYLIATDYDQLVAKDTKKDTTLDIKLRDIDRNVDFFYGWTGDEVTSEKTEAVADRRAADKMKDLYAEIEKVNHKKLLDPKSTFRHDLNVFFSRLLFCFFAEDTKVFSKTEKTIFTSSIKDFTQTDGSDLDVFLETLFEALDTEDKSGFTSPFSKFPYVNGTIFDTKKHNIAIPKFNAQARKLILDCGNQNWAEINPDIFGSMFQSIVDEDHRSNHGMHYTSVPNIMKTIEPLFLDEIREEFDKYYDEPKKLEKLWERISKIKIFDPACGSGNFLIIAYKELRKIEHGIIDRLFSDDYKRAMVSGKLESRIKLDNFYGIEIDDFAHEIAILSLYLAKHQMNIDFEQHFGKEIILIPLRDNAKIIHGNSATMDWQDVCPNHPQKLSIPSAKQATLIQIEGDQEELDLAKEEWEEIYLIGNPPYAGFKMQTRVQKLDIQKVFSHRKDFKKLDYICCWVYKAANYVRGTKAKSAFVTTSSISQGEHIGLLWPDILKDGVEIGFAHQPFKWTNSAKGNAGVVCIIIGLRNESTEERFLYKDNVKHSVSNINPYLVEGQNIFITKRSTPLSKIPKMFLGNMPKDDGNFLLSRSEYETFIKRHPEAQIYIKKALGAKEFLNGGEKWCLWITADQFEDAYRIEDIRHRIDKIKEFRLASTDKSANQMAKHPYKFREQHTALNFAVIIPTVTSERREYLPMSIIDKDTVVLAPNNVLYDPELYVLGLLSSRMHTIWLRAVAGYLGTSFRYSSVIVYNNFPVPEITEKEKDEITTKLRTILFTRESHSEKTLAEMYDPKKMPEDLREAHFELDLVIDRLYRSKPYYSDEERLSDLFSLYERMCKEEKQK